MMMAENGSIPIAFPVGMNDELQLLSQVVATLGIAVTSELSALTFSIPAYAQVHVLDDLPSAGFGRVELCFVVQEHAQFFYQFKEVAGLSTTSLQDASVSSISVLERSITCILAGRQANADVRCLYFGDAERIFKIKTLQDHRASNASSNVVIKAVLTDEARLTCHSMIKVAPGANGTNAEQVNKNILLSRRARAVSVPMLEVLANDVKCKHGAAVSRLNDEQAFYLQSRGISPTQTRTMLLEAFLT